MALVQWWSGVSSFASCKTTDVDHHVGIAVGGLVSRRRSGKTLGSFG